MKPSVAEGLQGAMMTLIGELAPEVREGYPRSTVTMLAVMQLLVAEEFDRAAEVRVRDNQAIRKVFRRAIAHVRDEGLAARLQAAASRRDTDLRIPALERTNAELRSLLIDLHEHVEDHSDEDSRRIDRLIWSTLRDDAERRAITLPGMG